MANLGICAGCGVAIITEPAWRGWLPGDFEQHEGRRWHPACWREYKAVLKLPREAHMALVELKFAFTAPSGATDQQIEAIARKAAVLALEDGQGVITWPTGEFLVPASSREAEGGET